MKNIRMTLLPTFALLFSLTTFAQIGNVRLGLSALANNSGVYNTAVGTEALRFNNGGTYNAAFGWRGLYKNTSGNFNVAMGYQALLNNTAGSSNIGIGNQTLMANSTGYDNTAVGKLALTANTTGYGNVAIGNEVLKTNVGGRFNTGMGDWALRFNTTGIKNAAGGNNALHKNTTGSHNAAWGNWALVNNTSGESNAAIGNETLLQNETGDYNSGIGWRAGATGKKNFSCTYLGTDAANSDTSSRSYSTAIGHAAKVTADNQIRLGSTSTQSIGGFVNWSNLSDGRYKKDLREDVAGLDFILQLRPVTYYLDQAKLRRDLNLGENQLPQVADKDGKTSKPIAKPAPTPEAVRYTGFIAQEVEEAAISTGFDFSGVDKPKNERDLYALRYAEFVVPLVKAVQEQQAQLVEQQQRIAQLEQQLQTLLARNGTIALAPQLRLSPNPASDVLQLQFQLSNPAPVQYSISDASGKILRQVALDALPTGTHQVPVAVRDLPAGTYFISLYAQGTAETAKFSVARR